MNQHADTGAETRTWYGVRCIFLHPGLGRKKKRLYEERVTMWRADGFDEAIRRAEEEAHDYAEVVGARYLGLAQSYHSPDDLAEGAEVFSLTRDSKLGKKAYLDTFFDTGHERQRSLVGEPGATPATR